MDETDATRRTVGTDTVLARAAGVLERRTTTSVIVLGAAGPVALRGTGMSIWDAFASPSSVADAAARLAHAYRAPVDVVHREMVPVLEELCAACALRVVPPHELDGASA